MSENTFFETKLGHVLRWIFFIPISLLGALLLHTILGILFFDDVSNSFLYIFPEIGRNYIFFMLCSFIIPSNKRKVLWLLFVINVALSLFWIVDPTTSGLSVPVLLIREIIIIALLYWYIDGGSYEK